ncbi:hypothetical protein LH51_08345 [Nitrincola sp. A-D6]|uniref:hypothetical protein n=1 Tax=Nitrincola sp. A-D6 TaxID=1545442 RepID=UPI00051FD265|nr:hypothetical protein [Nitrincola sp. A-D6]KGK42248.1 hypothetical protein LH51_08345 [Nitrincola sp. A-D6]
MNEVEKLNQKINDAKNAARVAVENAAQAQRDYDDAIETGDISRADEALQAKAAAERQQQIHSDHAAALESRRKEAERTDLTPVALEAMDTARNAVDAEREAYHRFTNALGELQGASDALRNAYRAGDNALESAKQALKDAHLYEHDAVERPRLEVNIEAIRELALKAPQIKQHHEGIQHIDLASLRKPWTPPHTTEPVKEY